MMEIEVKYQVCNLCNALCRNNNDNFKSVSFEIIDNGSIQTKIVLSEFSEQEEEYIDDLIAEFSAPVHHDMLFTRTKRALFDVICNHVGMEYQDF